MGVKSQAAAGLVEEMQERSDAVVEFIKKLGNPNRLMIACALAEGEKSVGELETQLGIRQPVLSQQLAELRAAGLIVGRRQVKHVHYRLDDARARAFIEFVHRLFCRNETMAIRSAPSVPRSQPAQSQAAVFAQARTNRR